MFVLRPLLEIVHFLKNTIFYLWQISLHTGRGIFLFLCTIYAIIGDIFRGVIIIGEELFYFLAELNASIDSVSSYIGNSTNSGISGLINAIDTSWRNVFLFLTKSKLHTRLLATNIGSAFKDGFGLLHGALALIADSVWWLIALIPRTICYLVITAADFCVFSLGAGAKGIIYIGRTIIDDLFRITIGLAILYMLWRRRYQISLILRFYFSKIKVFMSSRLRLVISRWNHYRLQRSSVGRALGVRGRRSQLPEYSRASINDSKVLDHQRCVVCRDHPKSVVLWPCRHMCLCEECADRMTSMSTYSNFTCPLCRSEVEFSLSVYT